MQGHTSSRFGIGAKARTSETGTGSDDSTRAELGIKRDGADR